MRVVLVNARPDAERNPGGDTVQLTKTREALRLLGLAVELCQPECLDTLREGDLVHVFNLQMPESAWEIFQTVSALGLPIVFSPIYWEEYELWHGSAREASGLWRRISRAAGQRVARSLYVAWQRTKERSRPAWKLQRTLLQSASAVLPNSQREALMLQKAFSLDGRFQQKVRVVPNGIDPALYLTPPKPDSAFSAQYGVSDFVLEVATIYPVKNQLAVLEALFDLPEPIVFIGHPHPAHSDYALECRRRGEKRGRVVFIDHVPHHQLPGIYALARVHVLPSWRETPGLASLEAAAAGCSIVTTTIGSASEYFGEEAWYCHPSDTASIRRAVDSALSSTASGKLRDRVLEKYTWHRAAEATAEAYAWAMSEL